MTRYLRHLNWKLISIKTLVAIGIFTACYIPLEFFSKTDELVDVDSLIQFEPPTTGRIYDRNGEVLIELAKEYRHIIRYEDIPPVMISAILATEDQRFFEHRGLDPISILRAGRLNALGRSRQGASTITQQLVKNYFPFLQNLVRNEEGNLIRKLYRKLQEARIALWVEAKFNLHYRSSRKAKEELLARYASFVYEGNGRYGFASASEMYCRKSLATLTIEDADCAATLAGIVKLPSAYAPSNDNLERITERRNAILQLMVENQSLPLTELRRQLEKKILPPLAKNKTDAPSGVEHVFLEMKQSNVGHHIEMLFEGRSLVFTTTDIRVQRISNFALERALVDYEKRHPEATGIIQGAVVVLDNKTGAILAEVGGRQIYKGRQSRYTDFNRATRSYRQPGSAFKPFVYLAAFEHGFTLDTPVYDGPIPVSMGSVLVGKRWIRRPPKWISNYDRTFKGWIPLRQALYESRNAVAIRIAQQVTLEEVLNTARKAGIETKLESYITTALGASEVNLLELTNAYRALISGNYSKPYIIQGVVSGKDRLVYGANHKLHPAPFNQVNLQLIQEGLRGVVKIPGGTAYWSMLNFPYDTLGKTGTTNDQKDAWFIGGTFGPNGLTIGVKVGFDEPNLGYDKDGKFGRSPSAGLGSKETGGRVALPVFREIIKTVYDQKIIGEAPVMPESMEARVNRYIEKNFEVAK